MSRVIRNFQVDAFGDNFVDSLNDSSVHSNWTQEPGGSTITEDGTDLTISDSGGSALEWDGSTQNAPNVNILLEPYNFTAKVFVSNIVTSSTNGGGIVHYITGAKGSYHYVSLLNDGGGDDIYTRALNVGTEFYPSGTSGSCWLALMRRGHRMFSFFSANAIGSEPDIYDMTMARTYVETIPCNNARIALIAETKSTGYPAISVEFRKFSLTYP